MGRKPQTAALEGGELDPSSLLPPAAKVASELPNTWPQIARLECLKLCHRIDHTPEQITERADRLFQYVVTGKADRSAD